MKYNLFLKSKERCIKTRADSAFYVKFAFGIQLKITKFASEILNTTNNFNL